MNELIEIYNKSEENIRSFLKNTIENFNSLKTFENSHFQALFDMFKSLELIYIVDADTKTQISPNYYRNSVDNHQMKLNRAYLLEKFENLDFAISKPYKSSATGNLCITLIKKEQNKFVFLDFNLKTVLDRFKLLEIHPSFDKITTAFYAISGTLMALFAFLMLGFSLFKVLTHIHHLEVMDFFKPIIYITIAVAIFDLAKTLLEGVLFKSYKKEESEFKTFIKFILSIMIALSIEVLMLVFKISLNSPDKMINALYLFIGISLMMGSVAFFVKRKDGVLA
jgi:ABC-type sugar transport system permease subunit